jgi:phosphatidylserine/phosphatidylglycerophosphate/cardiolipin synthase-like enzyme
MSSTFKSTSSAILLIALLATPAGATSTYKADVAICFTPGENCEAEIVQAIDASKDSIRVQAYGFTSQPIIHALQRAAQRNVEVLAILDKVNERRYSGATLLEAYGIPVWIDYQPAIAHNKVIVIDRHLTIGGSFNYTVSAQKRNAENVTFTDSKDLAARFIANWESRLAKSREFEPKSEMPVSEANPE